MLARCFYASRRVPPAHLVAMLRQSKGRLRRYWQVSAVAHVFPKQRDEWRHLNAVGDLLHGPEVKPYGDRFYSSQDHQLRWQCARSPKRN